MRVLLLTSAYPPVMGGAETYALIVASGLADRGHDVVVVTDTSEIGGGAEEPAAQTSRPRVIRLSGYQSLLADPGRLRWEQMYFGLLPETASALGPWRPDVVVTNSMETVLLGRMVAAEFGTPLVGAFHEHDPDAEPFGEGRMALAYKWAAPDAVLAGSTMYADRALRHLPADRVHLIHHGVDTCAFSPRTDGEPARRRYGVTRADVLVVTVGRLKERKGQLELLQAFAGLQARDDLRLVIAGGVSSAAPDYADRLEAEIDHRGLRDRVVIDRGLAYQDMPEILAAADIVALPSHSEGLGLALLEAMSAARPVVATRIAGFEEVLRGAPDVARLVDPGDAGELRIALGELAGSPADRDRLGTGARRHVIRRFSRQRMIDRTEAVLREVGKRS
jgi:glycosyltransferase involved in cell wall biosynthesis